MKKTIVEKHFDSIAKRYDYCKKKNKYYYDNLKSLLTKLIPENRIVLEIGCGTGELLACLNPSYGYGLDISNEMIKIARSKYKKQTNLVFSTKWPKQRFDYIFMSDVVEHLQDMKGEFNKMVRLMGPKTKFINTMANPYWETVLILAEKLGLKMPEGKHRRIDYKHIKLLVNQLGLKIIKHDYALLMPISIPLITFFLNKYLEKYVKPLAFIEYFIAVKKCI